MFENTEKDKMTTPITNKIFSNLYQAIKKKKLDDVRLILKDKMLVNASLFTSGSLAGYTALHVACMEENDKLVTMLVEDYHADVNIVAEDGTQPIHLTCLFGKILCPIILCILLRANADIEAKIERDIFLKYIQDKTWCDDFGDKMTILTFSVLYYKFWFVDCLLNLGANVKVKGCTNKTLLMYALEKHDIIIGDMIASNMNEEFLNARDDDGYHALHFIFHPNKYQDFRFDIEQTISDDDALYLMEDLVSIKELDFHATVNGDPATFILNMAAYRSSPGTLKVLLPFFINLKDSKALYYATLPPEDPQKMLRIDPDSDEEEQLEWLEESRKETIGFIVKDLVNRLSFGFSVPDEEKKIMDKLISTDKDIRELIHNYERNFIHGELKKIVIHYGDKTMTYYDFLLLSIDEKKIQLLVRDETFVKAYNKFVFGDLDDHYYFDILQRKRYFDAVARVQLLNKLKEVEQLTKAIPLPYECILDIVEYLKDEDLKTFIDSFYDD